MENFSGRKGNQQPKTHNPKPNQSFFCSLLQNDKQPYKGINDNYDNSNNYDNSDNYDN